MKELLVGNHTVSHAVRLARAQVIAAYPITPQTQVVELLSEMCADGRLDAKFIMVESEHSAMSALVAASAAGARTFTATSAQGLALMHEMLHWASGGRLPVVMANVNRALGPPWSIWGDQMDSLAQRDTGWMQLYCESNQEILDSILLAYKVAERVFLPAMVCYDGFFLSHTAEPVDIPEQEAVDAFLPPYRSPYRLGPDSPAAIWGLTIDYFMEFRYKVHEAMEEVPVVFAEECVNFHRHFGRSHGSLESYRCEDAELIIVTTGTISGTVRVVVDRLRDEGLRAGRLKLRMFRPFPKRELRDALRGCSKVVVLERDYLGGVGGVFAQEIRAALYGEELSPFVFGCIAGLGGRDVTIGNVREAIDIAMATNKPQDVKETYWIGLKR